MYRVRIFYLLIWRQVRVAGISVIAKRVVLSTAIFFYDHDPWSWSNHDPGRRKKSILSSNSVSHTDQLARPAIFQYKYSCNNKFIYFRFRWLPFGTTLACAILYVCLLSSKRAFFQANVKGKQFELQLNAFSALSLDWWGSAVSSDAVAGGRSLWESITGKKTNESGEYQIVVFIHYFLSLSIWTISATVTPPAPIS